MIIRSNSDLVMGRGSNYAHAASPAAALLYGRQSPRQRCRHAHRKRTSYSSAERMTGLQRDAMAAAWPVTATLTAGFVDDEFGHPALVVITDAPGAMPVLISASGRIGPGPTLPESGRFVVNRSA